MDDEPEEASFPSKFHQLTKRDKYVAAVAAMIGFTLGVLLFAVTLGRQYSHSLEDWEVRHNATLQAMQEKVDLVTLEKRKCLDDVDTQVLAVAELRGKLAARTKMVEQAEELQVELEARGRRVKELVEETRLREQEYYELRGIIDQQAAEMATKSKMCGQVEERAARLTEQRGGLTRQLKALDGRVHELNTQVGEHQLETRRYRDRIQQRESFLCKEGYGMGPYYVQITAKTRGDTDDDSPTSFSFVVELASRRDLPHSVFTFLSLVSYEMYYGTTFVAPEAASSANSILGLSLDMDAEVAFNQKRRAVGMQEYILMFPEISARFPCEEYSVGFQGLGPSLELYLSPSDEEASRDGRSCFGKIVRGVESIVAIQKSVSNGQAVDITHMQHLLL